MIPERISVQGFLCYRGQQEARFDGRSLWMLSGPNGSGKSTLFDAITFTLYGSHRGGNRQNAEALINRHSDRFIVEFDFRIEQELFRARRTLNRSGLPTRQILQWLPAPEGGEWKELPGTDSQNGFDAWVREHIGLTMETFAASVMLRQGQADRLLEARPAQRHEFLKEIVGLHHYEQLHESAKGRLSHAKARAADLTRRLNLLLEVTSQEIADAERTLHDREKTRDEAAASVKTLSEHLLHSQNWQKWDRECRELKQKMESFSSLLKEQANIETQFEEFQFLNLHLPTLKDRVELQQKVQAEEARITEVQDRQQKITSELEPLESELSRIVRDIKDAESDYDRQQERRRDVEQQFHQLKLALPWLEMLSAERKAIVSTREKAKTATATLEKIEADRERIQAEAPATATLEQAQETLQSLQTQLGAAAERRRETAERLERFHEVRHAQTCRYCGQELPPEHVEREAEVLQKECRSAQAAFEQIQAGHKATQFQHKQLLDQKHNCESHLRELQTRQQRGLDYLDSLKSEEVASNQRRQQAASSLPEEFQKQIADRNGTFPSDEELAAFHNQRTALAEEQQEQSRVLEQLNTRLKKLREEFSANQQKQQSLAEQLNELQKAIVLHETRRDSFGDNVAANQTKLPEDWQDLSMDEAQAQCPRLEHRLQELSDANIEGQFQQLQTAKTEHETNRALLQNLKARIDDIPAPARREPEEVAHDLDQAKHHQADSETQCREADDRVSELRRRRKERESLHEQYLKADRQRHLWDRLARLLGPYELQRHLVRQAERQIVAYAQAILDRLSSGTMHIELAPETEDTKTKALDLIARTDGLPEPLGADFLSGSQRFRVAVALSLAIGQYAGQTHRPVRSVVIDEGFGCLDTENRQVMIQELHNLRDHLDRIILVSHQDEFSQAFPDGYRCQPTDQGTQLVPVHR